MRPLVSKIGAPAKISRKHVIKKSDSGILYVMGGKYTTYRKIAEDVMRRLTQKPLLDTREEFPVYGSGPIEEGADDIAKKHEMDVSVIQGLMDFYGVRYKDVLGFIDKDRDLKQPICSCSSVIRAQIVYAIEREMACTEDDIAMRRLMLGYIDCADGQCREMIRKILRERKE